MIDMKRIKNVIINFNEAFMKNHSQYEFGCCGYGSTALRFGRKIKIRKELQAQGIVEKTKWGRGYDFIVPEVHNDIYVQTSHYNQGKERAIRIELREQLKDTGINVINNDWID